jgi:hypothetical protein
MEVPPELPQLLAGTLSADHAVRTHAEERLKFLEATELRIFFLRGVNA